MDEVCRIVSLHNKLHARRMNKNHANNMCTCIELALANQNEGWKDTFCWHVSDHTHALDFFYDHTPPFPFTFLSVIPHHDKSDRDICNIGYCYRDLYCPLFRCPSPSRSHSRQDYPCGKMIACSCFHVYETI